MVKNGLRVVDVILVYDEIRNQQIKGSYYMYLSF